MTILVTNITKMYGSQRALDDVSLDIQPGEVVGLLGPNGAGKSTLMKILSCFLPPSSGTASVCGFDVREYSIEVRKRVGYLPENNPLYPDLFVKEFLHFIGGMGRRTTSLAEAAEVKKDEKCHGEERSNKAKPGVKVRERVAEMIEITGLESEQHKKIGALSRGFRQRVGLAQALFHDPEVLILDEPTSGLDPNQLMEIRNLIKTIGRSKTVVLSTHIMQEVEAICDRAIIIHKGKIVADDATHNLQQMALSHNNLIIEFDKAIDQKMLRNIPGLKEAKPAGIDIKGRGIEASAKWVITSGADIDLRPDLFRFAVDHGLVVLSMHLEEQKLEEVFQELTRI